jgi:hypothetical protein
MENETAEAAGEFEIRAYPNPASNEINIETDADLSNSDVSVTLFDAIGTRYFHQTYPNGTSGVIQLDVSGLSGGMYFVRLTADGRERVLPVVKE